ncbi:MAG: hypothetical protein Q4D87_09125 [Actinomycetaceae bacterium]|nr:hypothetical protein [Actinomycetaceae bacterium]
MVRRRVLIATSMILLLVVLGVLTALALFVDVATALWGLVGFFAVMLLARLLGPDRIWLRARSRLFDAVFLLLIIIGLSLTITFATTPSPV